MHSFIQSELQSIVSKLYNIIGEDLITILLVGGFGRDEGATYLNNGAIKAVNDYDLIAIVSKNIIENENIIKEIDYAVAELSSELSVKQVDLQLTNGKEFLFPVPSLARYEISKGYKIIYGQLAHKIRCVPRQYLPLFEGTTYFRTRMSGLLIALVLLNSKTSFSRQQKLEYSFVELNKAKLVLGDSLLILKHDYHYSYRKRYKLIDKWVGNSYLPITLIEIYKQAIKDKLEPNFKNLSEERLKTEIDEMIRTLVKYFLIYESYRLKIKFTNITHYVEYFEKHKVRNKFYSLFNREYKPQNIKERIQLLRFYEKILIEGVGDSVKSILDYLKSWHPAGIVNKLK